jgi:hypothetical protein
MSTRRFVRLGPLLAVAAAVVLSPQAGASVPDAKPVRYFLHSASGSYRDDALGTMPFSAPAGSTMTADKPARATSATGEHRHGYTAPGLPTIPTFGTGFDGTVRSLCIDLFVRSDIRLTTVPPAADGPIYVNVRWFYGDATSYTTQEVNAQVERVTGTGVHRITSYRVAKGAPFAVTKGQPVIFHGLSIQNPDWTLLYDSAEHFSSITPNLSEKKCTAAKLLPPKK